MPSIFKKTEDFANEKKLDLILEVTPSADPVTTEIATPESKNDWDYLYS